MIASKPSAHATGQRIGSGLRLTETNEFCAPNLPRQLRWRRYLDCRVPVLVLDAQFRVSRAQHVPTRFARVSVVRRQRDLDDMRELPSSLRTTTNNGRCQWFG